MNAWKFFPQGRMCQFLYVGSLQLKIKHVERVSQSKLVILYHKAVMICFPFPALKKKQSILFPDFGLTGSVRSKYSQPGIGGARL